MAGTEPGERRDPQPGAATRRLDRPPSERYRPDARPTTSAGGASDAQPAPAGVATPVAKASLVAIGGAALLFAVGAVFASTAGLLFVAGLTGGAIGLLLARAAVPTDGLEPALTRRQVTWLAIGLSLAALAIGGLATWLYARGEGGTLGLVDYLLMTFGPFIPGEAVVATIAAAWGAGAGPVEG